jgi:hypothetical protein
MMPFKMVKIPISQPCLHLVIGTMLSKVYFSSELIRPKKSKNDGLFLNPK